LFYLSLWSTSDAASRFTSLYAASVARRYRDAIPLLRSAETGDTSPLSFQWNTSEGVVSIEMRGALVLVLEGFDRPTASKLRAIITAAARN
jgi:hypothetical protein